MAQASPASKLDQLPPEMLEFTLLKTTGTLTPRLGRLSLPGRKSFLTPGFIGITSRGVVPHISQDNFRKCVGLDGVYVAIEDCMYIAKVGIGARLTACSCREAPAIYTTCSSTRYARPVPQVYRFARRHPPRPRPPSQSAHNESDREHEHGGELDDLCGLQVSKLRVLRCRGTQAAARHRGGTGRHTLWTGNDWNKAEEQDER